MGEGAEVPIRSPRWLIRDPLADIALRRRERGRRSIQTRCGATSASGALGWRAYGIDEPETDKSPAVAFWCPPCARREFG